MYSSRQFVQAKKINSVCDFGTGSFNLRILMQAYIC
jgi:hypothetical protein